MSDASSDEPERKIKLESYYFQRRILFGCTVALFFGIIMWIVGMSTNRWFIVSGGDGIFVESHRRYFKSSHTGIWRYCRNALIPQPIDSNIIRNYTSFAASGAFAKNLKQGLITKHFTEDFPSESLPDLKEVTEINEALKQHMYNEWIKGNEAKFRQLKNKFEELDVDEKTHISKVKYVDPSQRDALSGTFKGLLFDIEYNDTHKLHLVVPHDLQEALFTGWENYGMEFVRLLGSYAKSLNIDPNIYVGDTKFIFQPPKPEKYQKKPRNGFIYVKWSTCKYHNLLANEDELAADPSVDEDLLDYMRTAASFSVVTIFVMILGFVFTVYTFLNPRYMFKRLAGGVHFIAGLSSVTVCKLMSASVDHASQHLKFAFPPGATFTFGFGFYFGCFVSTINFISCIMFFWYSRKRKGDKAINEELGMADENIQIGR